jgi:hypothetical protein
MRGLITMGRRSRRPRFPFALGDLDCSVERVHCGIAHDGKKYDFVGHISRDQYEGVGMRA